jgi:murein hydrolase activator
MRIFFAIFCLLLSVSVIGQQQTTSLYSKEQLEAKRKEILDAIRETEQQLEAIKNDKKATLGQLRALQNKLAERQKLIGNINDEIGDIDHTIRQSSKEVGSLKQKLELLKVRYAQSLRYAYETRSSFGMLAFLFSSNDFNDAVRRMKYLKKFRDFRKQQVEQIRITQAQLQHKIGTLNAQKAQKDELLSQQVQQKQVLLKETDQTNQVIQNLKGRESELMKTIEKNRQTTARINKAINAFIEKEMAEAAKRAEEEAKKTGAAGGKTNVPPGKASTEGVSTREPSRTRTAPAESPTLMLTPTDMALAANFEGNKGKLYWPVEKGYISDHFGTHPHPLAPKVLIDNNGIDIQTDPNAAVRAVFDGTVTKIFSTAGSSQVIMIEHGNYFTVYNGLESVSVKTGEHVTARQVIGHVANNDENVPTINFQIWKGGKKSQMKLNPEQWIGRLRG